MTLLAARCNPYGYTTDAGPRHLMGGMFGPEWAGRDLVDRSGIHGIGVCQRRAEGWFVMVCPVGHQGPRMPLCGPGIAVDARGEPYEFPGHVAILQKRMAGCCTRCVLPEASRRLWEEQRRYEEQLCRAFEHGDEREQGRLKLAIEDIGRKQVELTQRGLTPRNKLTLIEVS